MVHGTPAMKAAGAGDGDELACMAQVSGNAFKAADAGHQLGAAVAFVGGAGGGQFGQGVFLPQLIAGQGAFQGLGIAGVLLQACPQALVTHIQVTVLVHPANADGRSLYHLGMLLSQFAASPLGAAHAGDGGCVFVLFAWGLDVLACANPTHGGPQFRGAVVQLGTGDAAFGKQGGGIA